MARLWRWYSASCFCCDHLRWVRRAQERTRNGRIGETSGDFFGHRKSPSLTWVNNWVQCWFAGKPVGGWRGWIWIWTNRASIFPWNPERVGGRKLTGGFPKPTTGMRSDWTILVTQHEMEKTIHGWHCKFCLLWVNLLTGRFWRGAGTNQKIWKVSQCLTGSSVFVDEHVDELTWVKARHFGY